MLVALGRVLVALGLLQPRASMTKSEMPIKTPKMMKTVVAVESMLLLFFFWLLIGVCVGVVSFVPSAKKKIVGGCSGFGECLRLRSGRRWIYRDGLAGETDVGAGFF